jgi:phytoene dehydrogenase-like protein
VPDAVVVGAGPNGLVAANLLADRGWEVVVLEAAPEPGGGVRSAPLTGRPEFVHDVFSAFYPFAVASPAVRALDLEAYGLRWCHADLVVAHSAPDGTCAVLSPRLEETMASLEAFAPGDGDAWRRLYALWERVGAHLVEAIVTPMPPVRPGARIAAALRSDLIRFARFLALPLRRMADEEFRGAGGGRLLAGNASHAGLPPEAPGSGAFGWVLTCLGQEHGFPTPRGGAGELTAALVRRLRTRGGEVRCDAPVTRVEVRDGAATAVVVGGGERVEATRAVLADVLAPALYLDLVGAERLPPKLVDDLRRFQIDWSTVKVDWALDAPIPWDAEPARRTGVVHVLDDIDELTLGSAQIATGLVPAVPSLVMGQYAPVDPTRSPPGTDTAWAYTHVPRAVRGDAGEEGITGDWDGRDGDVLAERVERRIEALAPGFRARIRARHVITPAGAEGMNPNLAFGSMYAGTNELHQQAIFRPTPGHLGRPETPVARLYLASASAHPGGGVHGGPGANAARAALAADLRRRLSRPALRRPGAGRPRPR